MIKGWLLISDNIRLLDSLRIIAKSLEGSTPYEIAKAKKHASELYVSHTNRKINLSSLEFKFLLGFLQDIYDLEKSMHDRG